MEKRRSLRGLYAITPDNADTRTLISNIELIIDGGVALIQYRDKRNTPHERRSIAEALLTRCRAAHIPLIINDDLELALDINADGLHLGIDDGELHIARRALDARGPNKILGASCYADMDRARLAMQAGADYLAFGAAFPSTTKPLATCVPPDFFIQARREFTLPICAIGGITLDNAPILIGQGVDLLATINDLFSVDNIGERTRAYQQLFDR